MTYSVVKWRLKQPREWTATIVAAQRTLTPSRSWYSFAVQLRYKAELTWANVSTFLAQGNYVQKKWRRPDSNLEPPGHESRALPTRSTRLSVMDTLDRVIWRKGILGNRLTRAVSRKNDVKRWLYAMLIDSTATFSSFCCCFYAQYY